MTNGDDAAFAVTKSWRDDCPEVLTSETTLTKREYFAAQMMAALIANPERYKYMAHKMLPVIAPGQPSPLEGMSQKQASAKNANKAVMLADALIEALNK